MDPDPASFITLITAIDVSVVFSFALLFLLLVCSALISGAEVAMFSLSTNDIDDGLEQYPYDESIDIPINPIEPNPEKEPEPTPKQENPKPYKDPSQLSSYRSRKIEEEGKNYW